MANRETDRSAYSIRIVFYLWTIRSIDRIDARLSIEMRRIRRKVRKSSEPCRYASEEGRDGEEEERHEEAHPCRWLRPHEGKRESKTGSYILKGRRDSTAWPVSHLDPPKSGASVRDWPL